MHVVAGLGNPGPQYALNRHNIGFMAADAIVDRHPGFGPWQRKFNAQVAEGRAGGRKLLVIKPQTFMNRSGQSVGEALRFYKLDARALTVFYDELDLAPGKVRVKRGGGSGGHNGIKSLDAHCGKDYRRVRLGIGHPGDKALVHKHVLGDFAKADRRWLEPLLDAIGDHVELLLDDDPSRFMNKLAIAAGDAGRARSNDRGEAGASANGARPDKAQSRMRQRPPSSQQAAPSGPMSDMLKKLFGRN